MCPDSQIISAFLDGEVDSPWKETVSAHIVGCAACRSKLTRLEETRRLLRQEGAWDLQSPMERIRARILSQAAARPAAVPFWQRRLTVPVPAAAAAAVLVLLMAFALVLALFRMNIGTVHITRAPAGTTEIRIAAPVGNLENLLKTFETQDASQEVITIPNNYRLTPVGEPLMGTEDQFLRKKPW
jgi:anti-sigma factor RsiW